MDPLERLLFPLEPAMFFRDVWEQRHHLLQRRAPGHFADLFSVDDVDAVIGLGDLLGPQRQDIRLIKQSADRFESRPGRDHAITTLSDVGKVIVGTNDAGDLYLDNVVLAANVKRRLTLKHGDAGFSGKLKPKGKCAKRQKVVVLRKKGGADTRVGADRTSAAGRYSVREPNPRLGIYYAKAGVSFEQGAGNCLAARSKVLGIGRPD